MSDSSEKAELPQLYDVAVVANVGTFCLVAIGIFLVHANPPWRKPGRCSESLY